jgi:hypothetical protein
MLAGLAVSRSMAAFLDLHVVQLSHVRSLQHSALPFPWRSLTHPGGTEPGGVITHSR